MKCKYLHLYWLLVSVVLPVVSFGVASTRALEVDAQTSRHEEGFEELYQSGREALGAGRYREAIRYLEKASGYSPEDAELFYWLGAANWKREQGGEAIRAYRLAVEVDPEGNSEWSLYALENLAEVYTRTERLRESKEAYLKALKREIRLEWITRIKNQLAELDLALGIYKPDGETVFNDKGEIIGGVGPDRMRTNQNFEIARHTNDPEKEAEYYRLAVETDPGMYQPYFNLGLALVHQGKYREAIPWLERSDVVWKKDSSYNPEQIDKVDAHAFLALCHLESGDLEKARDHTQRALAANDSYFWALLYAQRVNIASGQAEEALAILEGLVEENPDHAETLYGLSLAYAALDLEEKSRQTLAAAIESIPEDHPWMERLARWWSQLLSQGKTSSR